MRVGRRGEVVLPPSWDFDSHNLSLGGGPLAVSACLTPGISDGTPYLALDRILVEHGMFIIASRYRRVK